MQAAGTTAKRWVVRAVTLLLLLAAPTAGSEAQQRRQRAIPIPVPPIHRPAPSPSDSTSASDASAQPQLPPETVQADISTRRIAVTSSFSGTEIVVFGAVDNSRQTSAEAGLYDIVIVIAGTPTRLVARKKNRVGGIWLNTDSMSFLSVPSYYAIVSTRPLDEIASSEVLKASSIGFDHVPMVIAEDEARRPPAEIKEFREAVVRLKRREKLYSLGEYNVAFIGRSLFRASVDVPANVTVGSFDTRVYLFKHGELLSQYNARLNLEREGVEDVVHAFAFRYPFSYGMLTVLLSCCAGLLASAVFRRNTG
jgi:uncharacterized protein (TIGR02186 family)